MSGPNSLSTPSISPSSETPPSPGRDSSMPDMQHHTARLRRLSDKVPARVNQIPFTGASSAKANRRLRRLAPPPAATPVKKAPAGEERPPAYYGADAKRHERRSKRYVDRANGDARRGGAPVFSGADVKAHNARMLKLMEHA